MVPKVTKIQTTKVVHVESESGDKSPLLEIEAQFLANEEIAKYGKGWRYMGTDAVTLRWIEVMYTRIDKLVD